MKRINVVVFVLVFAFVLVGCGSEEVDDGKLNLPISSSDLENTNYEDVIAIFETEGFTNIKTEVIDDLIFGWLTKDGEVEEVSVDGYTTFNTDNRYPPDVEIVVSYHTFAIEVEEEAAVSSTPEIMIKDVPTKPYTPEPTVKVETTKKVQSTEETQSIPEEEIITLDNNEEFAEVLNSNDPGDQIIKNFALKYAGRTIEFDGNIVYISNHGEYTTRYDFLISPWDYSETTISGPNFQFRDCSVFDLNFIGDNIPDGIEIGDNFHFVARILNYNDTQQLFFLDPISTEVR